jgi:hypothetical protein
MKLFQGDFKRLFYTDTGRIIISVLMGLGIATLFRKVCKDKNCIDFRGPTIVEVEGKTFQYDDKCYKYHARASKHDETKKHVEMCDMKAAGGGAVQISSPAPANPQPADSPKDASMNSVGIWDSAAKFLPSMPKLPSMGT